MDTFDINDIQDGFYDISDYNFKVNENYQPSVCTISCPQHPLQNILFEEAKYQLRQFGQVQCQCGAIATSSNELIKSLDQMIHEQFHKSINSISIINGLMINKYTRKLKIIKNLLKENSEQMKNLIIRSKKDQQLGKNFQINEIIKTNPQIQNIQIYCGKEKVRMNIPTRLIYCKNHIQCYDLLSLLLYFQQQKKEGNSVDFVCEYCQYNYSWNFIQDVFNNLVIDLDLLNCINKSVPFTYQLFYDAQSKKIKQSYKEFNKDNIDPLIETYYNIYKYQIQYDLNTFEQMVIKYASLCASGSDIIDQKIKETLDQQKYQCFKINLIDQYTGKRIEYPARCINCKDYNKCSDLRSIMCDYQTALLKRQIYYQCKLCGKEYPSRKLISYYIYIDYNVIQKINSLYEQISNSWQLNEFYYDGKQYMLEEFRNKQKIKYQDYLESYNKINDLPLNNQQIKFNTFNCDIKKIPLNDPLIIKECNTVIEFNTFYDWFKSKQFKIQENFDLCQCQICQNIQRKPIFKSVRYHEALGMALQKHESKGNQREFLFDFKDQRVVYLIDKTLESYQRFTNQSLNSYYDQIFNEQNIYGYFMKIETMEIENEQCRIQYTKDGVKEFENYKNSNYTKQQF